MISLKKLLTNICSTITNICNTINGIGVYSGDTVTGLSTVANIDTFTTGITKTFNKGVYLIVGSWVFNTRSGSGSSNRQVCLRKDGNIFGRFVRTTTGGKNYGALQVTNVVTISEDNVQISLCGSCSDATTTNDKDIATIHIVRLGDC